MLFVYFTEAQDSAEWLKIHLEPDDEVKANWRKSFTLRITNKAVGEALIEKHIKPPLGSQLVNISYF